MTAGTDQRAYRLGAIDALRGLAIVLMAIDHCRDFLMHAGVQDPMSDPNVPPELFATRWITHFCAPVFVLLAGTSAGLMSVRRTPAELGRFLLARGLWLIAIECLVVSNAWTFSPLGAVGADGVRRYWVVLQVIWALGVGMVALAALQRLGRRTCLAVGAAVVLGHNLLDPIWPQGGPGLVAPWWTFLHARTVVRAGPLQLAFAYPILPWIGVMALGFGIAPVFEWDAARRRRFLLRAGAALIGAFVVVRFINVYGDPKPWRGVGGDVLRTVMSFLNANKYPPSLDYLLMTLGPAAMFCAVAERMRGAVRDMLIVFGRAPFAFYVAHLYLLHLLALVLGVFQGYDAARFVTPFSMFPKVGFGLSLGGVYLAWVLVVAALYPLCRWVGSVKARRRDWWLSYL